MTDFSAAAAALDVPEALVRRSAEARAKADNVSLDELVAAWAGGGAAPTGTAPPVPEESPPSPQPEAVPAAAPAPAPAPTAPVAPSPTPPIPSPEPVRSGEPPVLVGASQSISAVMAGAVGLLLLSILIGFLVPSLTQPQNEVRSSNHAFSSTALGGQEIYMEMGCASCHTQLVRAVVADASLGPVTLADTNQVVGYRRLGPDLAGIGDRIESTEAIVSLLNGEGRHPVATGLSDEELASLLAYLRESR
ncbi:MAG TPA: cbb3-type cytochrome c oxidase subunit II [Acidimicrobiia bacterium]|nr:cbb3-type cytochrome c oxidase subunit II [Acidimicrobiia bacterium]